MGELVLGEEMEEEEKEEEKVPVLNLFKMSTIYKERRCMHPWDRLDTSHTPGRHENLGSLRPL